MLLDTAGDQHLGDLAAIRLLVGEVEIARQLLRESAAALSPRIAQAKIEPERAQHPPTIYTIVLVKALVLDGNRPFNYIRGDGIQRNGALITSLQGRQTNPIAGSNTCNLIQARIGQTVDFGQIPRYIGHRPGQKEQQRGQQRKQNQQNGGKPAFPDLRFRGRQDRTSAG